VNSTFSLTPLKVAVTTIQPLADNPTFAEKPALMEPCGTMTVAGTVSPRLLLERPIAMFPADFDTVTVHALLEPAAGLVGTQANEDKTGVDQSVKLAVWDDVPSVAVTEPVASALMLPILALKAPVVFPAVMTMLAGTVIRADVELNVTVVLVRAGCDSAAVHELVAPDITPLGLHASDVTSIGAINEIVTD